MTFSDESAWKILFYARGVDNTMLMGLNAIAVAKKYGQRRTLDAVKQHPDAKVTYEASDMVLHVHSDASYLSSPEGRSRAGGFHFL